MSPLFCVSAGNSAPAIPACPGAGLLLEDARYDTSWHDHPSPRLRGPRLHC